MGWRLGALGFSTAPRQTGNLTIVRLLLQAGANPNAPDDNGWSPLRYGAQVNNPTAVSHLLEAGTELNAGDHDGYPALHWPTAQSGNGRVIKVLRGAGGPTGSRTGI